MPSLFHRPKWENVNAPAVFWAGWNDIFLDGNYAAFNGYNTYGTGSRGKTWMVVDPLGHCQEAANQYKHDVIAGRNAIGALMAIALFTGELDKSPPNTPEKVKRVTFYVMGANYNKATGNFWTTADAWPKSKPTQYFMKADGTLEPKKAAAAASIGHSHSNSHQHPRESAAGAAVPSNLTYAYDPKNPVPTIGGNNLILKCGPKDQTPVESRPDVLVFTSAPLKEPLVLTGPLTASLFVSSMGVNDTDFTVKLTDVYPDGKSSHLIQDGIVRMRWRERGLQPVPIKPGKVELVNVSLWATSYIYSVGHRIRVAVSSSNYPRFATNPNTGLPISTVEAGGGKVTKIATNSLHFSEEHRPSITLPVISLADVPPHPILDTYASLTPEMKRLGDRLFAQSKIERKRNQEQPFTV